MSQIALVTGASRGLGKNMALNLAKKGVDVIITYNSNEQEAQCVVSEIQNMGQKAFALQYDASKINNLDTFVDTFQATLNSEFNSDKFDFLINNAGIGATIAISQVSEQDFDNLFNIHFKSVYFLTQKLLPIIRDNGRVINISSGTTRFANPGYSVYASAKGAIEVFTRYLAKEIGIHGITANVVAPGAIETDFNGGHVRDNPQINGFIAANTALGRVGKPDDIGGVITFLCSDDARWINGQRIEVSGGVML
jgi:NAD(P)-dependent dehydrogenase (short-subunit alcohol dehydrogenase family)